MGVARGEALPLRRLLVLRAGLAGVPAPPLLATLETALVELARGLRGRGLGARSRMYGPTSPLTILR